MSKISEKLAIGKLGDRVAASAAVAALACIAISPAATAADFQILCQVLDETEQFEKTEFRGGETAVLALGILIPEDVYQEKMRVRAEARAKIMGIRYKVDLPATYITIPKKSDRASIPGYTPNLQQFTPFRQLDTLNNVDVYKGVRVKLPNNIPNTDLTLRAIGSIEGHGEQSCEKEIELNN
jgi:hypothetical protein